MLSHPIGMRELLCGENLLTRNLNILGIFLSKRIFGNVSFFSQKTISGIITADPDCGGILAVEMGFPGEGR